MNKRLTLLICLLSTIILFSACSKPASSKESKGVPKSVILRDVGSQLDDYTSYKIKHNVDPDAHIDDAVVELCYNGNFGTKIVSIPYSYQYDKSNDTWELLEKHKESYEFTINEKAYINSSPWTGIEKQPDECNYSITFHEFDLDACTARISYKIDFYDNGIADICGDTTVTLSSRNSTSQKFYIEYSAPNFHWIEQKKLKFYLTCDGLLSYYNYRELQ